MTNDGPPPRHLHPVEPPYDPEYDHRGPSHDPAAERALLALLVTDPTTAPTITNQLQPDDFYRPEHETIWNTWHHLHDRDGVPPDPITLNHHLLTTKQTNAVRALTDIAEIGIRGDAHTIHADRYIRIIRDHARIRTAQQAHQTLGRELANATPDTINRALGDAVDTITDAALRFGPTTHHTSTWTPLNLTDVLAGKEVDPPPTLLTRTDGAHMLYDGAIHTLSGEPGSGKTWVALIAAAQSLTNSETVTMIDFEDRASRVVGRLLALGTHPHTIQERFRYIRPNTAIDTTTRTDLQHATTGTRLVILDGVTEAMTLHGLDLNANADVATFYELLPRHIADHSGATVLMIDHVVKDGEKQGRWALGGQHKLAGIDGVAYLVKAIEPFGRGKQGHARITVSKDRPGYIEEIALGRTVAELHLDARDVNCLRYTLDAPTALTKDEAGNMRPTHLMERVSRYIEITPGLGKNELLDGRISGKKEYLKRAIDRLLQEGYLEVATGPNRKQIHRSINPYREDEDAMHANPGWADQEPLS